MAETFGDRMKRLRTERKLSRYAVAKLTGLSQPMLMKIERYPSGANVRGGTLRRLARLYGVSIEYLLGPDDEEEHAA
jgi:transcriptional regulator with XRE-family HTH domain